MKYALEKTPSALGQAHGKSAEPPKSAKSAGFTLIEVVVAVGIVATVFIAFMGMLPLGMDTMREANATTTQARIAQKIIGELQLSDWRADGGSGIEDFRGRELFFDEFGNQTDDGNDRIYKAVIDLSEGKAEAPKLPGGSPNDYLRQVEVKIVYAPAGKEVDFDDEKNREIVSYMAMIADLEKRKEDLQ